MKDPGVAAHTGNSVPGRRRWKNCQEFVAGTGNLKFQGSLGYSVGPFDILVMRALNRYRLHISFVSLWCPSDGFRASRTKWHPPVCENSDAVMNRPSVTGYWASSHCLDSVSTVQWINQDSLKLQELTLFWLQMPSRTGIIKPGPNRITHRTKWTKLWMCSL